MELVATPLALTVNPNGDNSAPGSGKSPINPNAVFVPEMEEVRVSPVVSKRGYINICDQRTKVSRFVKSPQYLTKPVLLKRLLE